MRLSHLADYAVVLMTAAARRPAGERLSATELSADTGVPLPTTQKLMGQLAASGLVEAVEGPIALTMCSDANNHECALDAHCRVKPHIGVVGTAVRGALDAVSLEALCSPVQAGAQGDAKAALTRSWTPAYAGERPS
jgi:DNA-binding IscR family transcriptional regulator